MSDGVIGADVEGRELRARVEHIRNQLSMAAQRVGRDPASVRLLAATKTVPVEVLRGVALAGLRLFGENRLQEALPKIEALGHDTIDWHFIGRLQRRKVKQVVGRFSLIHSVDSVDLAREIDRRAAEAGICQSVLLEINVGGEASKGGFAPDSVAARVPEFAGLSHLAVRGLMAIPPYAEEREHSRPYFRLLRQLAEELNKQGSANLAFHELSMGMSHDYMVAVEEGATLVRIGTALFGARPLAG